MVLKKEKTAPERLFSYIHLSRKKYYGTAAQQGTP
jgi:hypothetical protein